MFSEQVGLDTTIDWEKIDKKYNYVYGKEHAILEWLFEKTRKNL